MEVVSPQTESLGAVGKEVLQEFTNLIALVDQEYQPNVSNEMQRFDLWASSLGLYHTGHSSLDYRFRDSPPLFQYALGLLNDLLETLSIVAQLAEETSGPADVDDISGGDVDSEEEDLSSYPSEELIKEYLCNITITVDRLYALSFKVRNPAARTGLSRGLSGKDLDDDTRILIEGFKRWDLEHIIDLFRTWRNDVKREDLENHFLVRRLALANTHRRQQFKYWERRRAKYERYHRAAMAGLGQSGKARSTGMTNSEHGILSEPTTATGIGAAILADFDNESMGSKASYALKGDEIEEKNILPAPPEIDPELREFECPYCFILCSRRTLQPGAWERHVIRDMRPYICTFEACKEPSQQYDTRPDWIGHEISKHGCHPENPRKCPLCLREGVSAGHIASHLQRVAAFALPRLHNEPNDTGAEFDEKVEMGHSTDRSFSLNGSVNDESADSQKTVHLVMQRPEEKTRWVAVSLRPMHPVQSQIANAARLFLALDVDTEFKFTDEDGTETPLEYDLLDNGRVIYVRPLTHPDHPGRSAELEIRGRPLQLNDIATDRRWERSEMQVFQRERVGSRSTRSEAQRDEELHSPQMAINIPTGSDSTQPDMPRPKDGILRRIGKRLGIGRGREDSSASRMSEHDDPPGANRNISRRLSRTVVPGLPRPLTFKRQQSELVRTPSPPSAEFRRAISADRRRAAQLGHRQESDFASRMSEPEFEETNDGRAMDDSASQDSRGPAPPRSPSIIMSIATTEGKSDLDENEENYWSDPTNESSVIKNNDKRDELRLPDFRIAQIRYSVQDRDYFQPGKVFSILWHENDGRDGVSGGAIWRSRYAQVTSSTVQHMVVLKAFEQYSWCFTIITHNSRYRDFDPSKHAVIYMSDTVPEDTSDEPRMVKEPLAVERERADATLDQQSRLNFGKIYTVEHDVKVAPVGMLSEESLARFVQYARVDLSF
ncbi:hypothetical protein BJX66DRAFT_299557 [Aspergillus keveii]|uniref:Uncharacterized protein n=1 Tax=Aspergillus keveii TaxID=714993 RepID=A0ABR4GC81_9EURO